MKIRTDIRDFFGRNGLALARDSRVKAGAAAVALCAAAAAVAAVPSASASDTDQSSVTLAVPRPAAPAADTVFAEPTNASVQLSATARPNDDIGNLLIR